MVLLIYDNKCYLCGKFARTARRLSRESVDIVGHYDELGISTKNKIFPGGFDPNTMFWIVKDDQAFGGRAGLIPLVIEIIKDIFRPSRKNNTYRIEMKCSNKELSCNKPTEFIRRILGLMKNGKKIEIGKLKK